MVGDLLLFAGLNGLCVGFSMAVIMVGVALIRQLSPKKK
jgi:hypothetical protein